jgi:hypothetical protein
LKFIPKRTNCVQFIQAQALLNKSKKYNSNVKVKSILRKIYGGLCTYCESYVDHNSFCQTEHFYPKVKYRHLVKDFRNLHYCCQRCNNLKRSKDPVNILSPNFYFKNDTWYYSDERKIEGELYWYGPFLFSLNKNPHSINRAQNTIDMFDLNAIANRNKPSSRRYLLEMRIREYNRAYNIMKALYELLVHYDPALSNAIKLLFDEIFTMMGDNSQYSTMIIHNYGSSIINMIKIYQSKCL